MSKGEKIGIIVSLLGCIFAWSETIYFGSNWFPMTLNEAICDIISLIIMIIGVCIIYYNRPFRR